MKMSMKFAVLIAVSLPLIGNGSMMAQPSGRAGTVASARPQRPCDIYGAAGDPCVAAHSTTRALYASYTGPLYQVLRQSDGKTLDIGVVKASVSPSHDEGGYADADAQDAFCANTYCWIAKIYDQSPKHNDLTQAPRGGFSGPAMGGFNNLPLADMAPITIMGHKAYGVFIAPGMGLRQNDVKGTAVDDQAEGQYWVISGAHFNSGCCFDYGNAEIDSRDDDNGTMETTYFGDANPWYHGNSPGPWVMTDQENNLVGCVNPDGSKLCVKLPNIPWRFVTAMAKGEPHRWTSMGGDAQNGALSVMFDGPRVNSSYDPMRKQGAILLGNGGDNSVGSQGTFYEGAMTASGTFPTDATDQLVQANVVSAGYGVQRLAVAPASAMATPPGLQTFTLGSLQESIVTFTNTTASPITSVTLSLNVPGKQWSSLIAGTSDSAKTFAGPLAPGASVSATFNVTSGPAAFNGDLMGHAVWSNSTSSAKYSETTAEKVRNVSPIRINEFRINNGHPANATDSFIELYNAGDRSVDLSGWSLTARPAQQAIFSTVSIPGATRLAPRSFYLIALSNSSLSAPVRAGDATLNVRSTAGMSVGDVILVDTSTRVETRKVAKIGTAAGNDTTVWQPLPDGPVITVPAGSTNVPVQSVAGFAVGEKIALGYGATYPAVARGIEHVEVATVTAVGKPGTQAYLAADAGAGASNIQVTSVENITAGDKIRLDIDSVGHGIESVTIKHVGSKASQTNLTTAASAGATSIKVRRIDGFAVGDTIAVGTPASRESVTVTAIGSAGLGGATIDFAPGLVSAHGNQEWVVAPGTGLDLSAPLKFNHAANLPFSARGTGISFQPATAFAHSSNEPVRPLGSGVTLDSPLSKGHEIDSALRDAAVTTAGYQGTPEPNQWFGAPELTTNSPQFGRTITVRQGSMVLRDASGLVVDSLNYGGLVDPWAAKGYQATSGAEHGGCFVAAPGPAFGFGFPGAGSDTTNMSAGRFPDGVDSDSNCTDFLSQAASPLAVGSTAGATNIKVATVAGFLAGQTVTIDTGNDRETAVIANVGTGGGGTVSSATSVGATDVPVATALGFRNGQTITIDSGANSETVVIVSFRRFGAPIMTVSQPLTHAHAAGALLSGTGITLAAGLARAHANGALLTDHVPTPGGANRYSMRTR